MAEPNEIADSGKAAAPQSKIDSTVNLPSVESPPLSPANTQPEKLHEPLLEAQMKVAPTAPSSPPAQPAPRPTASQPMSSANPSAGSRIPHLPPLKIPQVNVPLLGISRRNRRRAAMAATVVLAAGFGAAVGAIANRAPVQAPPKPDTALIEENHLLQRSVAKLAKDVGSLKTSIEASVRENRSQITKVGEQLNEKLSERARAPEITGSITKPATVAAAAPAPAEKPEAAPMPPPRPAIVQGWTVHEARNGRVIVESRGEFFQIAPGVPLPGLGRVEAIRREGDTVVVVTPKGLITSSQSTAAIRSRPYPSYYRQY